MYFCFVMLLFLVAPAWGSAASSSAALAKRLSSEVKVDQRTGRLVRVVVVSRRTAQVPPGSSKAALKDLSQMIAASAKRHGVDPELIHSVVQVESNYNPLAVSPKGAQGIMQLMPATARRFGVQDTFDAGHNIEGGVRYLRFLFDRFPDDLKLVLAAYNAGEGAVERFGGVPPFQETQDYVKKIVKRYKKGQSKTEPSLSASSPAEVELPEYRPIELALDEQGRVLIRTQ